MIPSLSQEDITQYASETQTIQEPAGADYSQGVGIGKTIPAKWWNWLFSAITKRISQSRSDTNNMLTELKNVVTDAGLTPSASDNTQLLQSVVEQQDLQIAEFVSDNNISLGRDYSNFNYFLSIPGVDTPTRNLPAGCKLHSEALGDIYVGQKHLGDRNYCLIVSTDFEHFYGSPSFSTDYDFIGNAWIGTFACALIDNQLYFTVTKVTRVDGYLDTTLYRSSITSAGFGEIETLGTNRTVPPSSPSSGLYHTFATVINNNFYAMTCAGDVIKWDTETNTFSTVQAVRGLGQKWPGNADLFYTSFVPAVRAQDCYYVGNVAVSLDGESWTPVFNSYTNTYGTARYYGVGTIRPILMPDGSVFFSAYTNRSYGDPSLNIRHMRMDAQKNVSTLYGYDPIVTGDQIQGFILVRRIQPNDRVGKTYVSYDCVNFIELQGQMAEACNIIRKGSSLFLWCGSYGLFTKEGDFSEQISDYTQPERRYRIDIPSYMQNYSMADITGTDYVALRGYAVTTKEFQVNGARLVEGKSVSNLDLAVAYFATKTKVVGIYYQAQGYVPLISVRKSNCVKDHTLFLR